MQRSLNKELLDYDDIPFDAIKRNMQELNFINTWLGGHAITLTGFRQLLGKRNRISVCEIGCGGGDNLAVIVRYCLQNNIDIRCTGIDIKQACIHLASQHTMLHTNTEWVVSDYAQVRFAVKPDIIFSSLFCHHFSADELVQQLQWMRSNARLGFFINDLQRSRIAFISIKFLTKLFSSSYLVKNDAPLSVARSFTRKDWENLFSLAGIQQYSLRWKWAFRYLIICGNG